MSINPWMVVGGAVAVVSLIFFAGKWVGGIAEFKKHTMEFIAEIRDDIKKILERLPPVVVSGGSPLRLTDLGKSISQTVDAAAWAERIAPDLRSRVQGKQPYEIQEVCLNYIREEFKPTEEQDDKIKACASENGIDAQKVLDVLAVELRDNLLASLSAS